MGRRTQFWDDNENDNEFMLNSVGVKYLKIHEWEEKQEMACDVIGQPVMAQY